MVECQKCGAKYPTERLFCGKCRERIGIRCSVCGFINLLGDIFCGICLTELEVGIHVPDSREHMGTNSPSNSLYEEIRMQAEADEASTKVDSRISQEEIAEIFQKDEES